MIIEVWRKTNKITVMLQPICNMHLLYINNGHVYWRLFICYQMLGVRLCVMENDKHDLDSRCTVGYGIVQNMWVRRALWLEEPAYHCDPVVDSRQLAQGCDIFFCCHLNRVGCKSVGPNNLHLRQNTHRFLLQQLNKENILQHLQISIRTHCGWFQLYFWL